MTTAGSSFDTLLAVYTGNAVNSLTHVISGDDCGDDNTSCVAFNAVSGTDYKLAVDGYNNHSGSITLDISLCTTLVAPTPSGCGGSVCTGTPTLSWGNVANESGYVVRVFSGNSCLGAPIHTSAQLAANSTWYAVPAGVGLRNAQSYSWQVQAKGNGTSYCDSPWSSCCWFSTDAEPPSINCPANIVTDADNGQCSKANVTYIPTAADNCPGVNAVCTPSSGSTFPKGVTTVTCTATDASGNTASCTFTVTINDTVPPIITGCPADISTGTDADQCGAVVSWAAPTASDNCAGAVIVNCTPASGSTFNRGETTVTCTASDGANMASCTFKVTVRDDDAPVITSCPADISIGTDADTCGAVVSWATPVATDNCAGAVAVTCAPVSGSTFNVGRTTVNCTATDTSGNTAICSFTVTIQDTQPPQIICPADIVADADPGQSSKGNVTYTATATDNCPGVTVACVPPSSSTFPTGVTTVTCTATDSSGNATRCVFTVTVGDAPPVIVCPADFTVPADAGLCSATNVVYTVTPSDNHAVTNLTCVPPSGSTFAVGDHVVSCTATDSSGNTNQCSFRITAVGPLPTIVREPASRSNVAGSSAMFGVTATGTGNLSYQWQKDGTNLHDATARTYTIMGVASDHAGSYRVVVTDACGATQTSSNAYLTVTPLAPPGLLAGPVVNPANGHFYYLLDQSTWVEAEAAAVQLGGHLATVRNTNEQEWILSTFGRSGGVARDLWIGLYDADPLHNATTIEERRAEFVWASQEPVTFSLWDSVEPNNYRDMGEFWVEMVNPDVYPNGLWNDVWDRDVNYAPLHGVVEVIVKFLPPTVADGQIRFRLLGELGKDYVIEFSTNLNHPIEWQKVTTLRMTNGGVPYNTNALSRSGFFRAVLKP